MLILLDTSVAILLRDLDVVTTQRVASLSELPLLSAISLVELEGGLANGDALRRQRLEQFKAAIEILEFGEVEATAYGAIVNRIGFSRRLIIDRMIAAQAMTVGAVLATLNPRDFRGITGLQVEDWSVA